MPGPLDGFRVPDGWTGRCDPAWPAGMSMPERFTMADLVARTGVPAASVRHYLALGLLPEPQRVSSNRFVYDDRHVEALRLIRVLRERRHLGLSDIGALLPELLGV
ncbi:MAG: MerR family transcriptional regulator, partial [Acidimicrobiales bacterium]|nr:MerR family transcriptional regulator [Acidimicrobiales bacterium]